MTLIRFETRDRNRALSFLRGHYPNSNIEDIEESAKDILDLVSKDVFRIPDPNAHSGTIYPSKNWPKNKEEQDVIIDVLSKFHTKAKNTKKHIDF